MEVASQNTASSENIQENADEIASNEDSSSSSDFSYLFNKTVQQNDNGIQVTPENRKVYKCRFHCGKTYVTFGGRFHHEKIHSGIGLVNCEFCDRQFTHRQQCENHQRAHHKQQTPAAKKQTRKRIPSRVKRIPSRVKGFSCEFCGRKFADLGDFEKHQRMYPDEDLKKCRFPPCTKKFCFESLRLRHEKSHSRM